MRYLDRRDAGRRLAGELMPFAPEHPVVVALPRGGVPVALEVARALRAPLEILAVRKLGAPGNPELAVGAVAEDGTGVLDPRSAGMLGMTQAMLDATLAQESAELRRRVERYRDGRTPTSLAARTVIVVDDGLATGLTVLAAVRAVRKRGAQRIVVGVPVGASESIAMLAAEADEVVCAMVPKRLFGVGMWYEDFAPVSDEQVLALLSEAKPADEPSAPHQGPAAPPYDATAAAVTAAPRSPPDRTVERELSLELEGVRLGASLSLPVSAHGLVLFAHGSGSSRFSPRNRWVAESLAAEGLATLLFDLLDEQEARERALVFDVGLLAARLQQVTEWASCQAELAALPIGYFGASTGAAAALRAAGALGDRVAAVVSRGGRPDLAGESLAEVACPTLLIVGSLDREVLGLNRQAAARLRCEHEIVIVEGAGHLFEEPGALQRVAEVATDWFRRHLGG